MLGSSESEKSLAVIISFCGRETGNPSPDVLQVTFVSVQMCYSSNDQKTLKLCNTLNFNFGSQSQAVGGVGTACRIVLEEWAISGVRSRPVFDVV